MSTIATSITTTTTTTTIRTLTSAMIHDYECASFTASEEQHIHRRSERSLYNVRRQNADLAPMDGVDDSSISPSTPMNGISYTEKFGLPPVRSFPNHHCPTCPKIYNSQEKFPVTTSRPRPSFKPDSSAFPMNPLLCLFCDQHSATVQLNVHHMIEAHSFFIPHSEHLADLSGFLHHFANKIASTQTCLWCHSEFVCEPMELSQNVRNHIADNGHCTILHENGTEKFYAFNSFAEEEENDEESDEEENSDEEHEKNGDEDDACVPDIDD